MNTLTRSLVALFLALAVVEVPANPNLLKDFMELPADKREEFSRLKDLAIKQYQAKNHKGARATLAKMDDIISPHPLTLNLLGACYVGERNFVKAKAIFTQAHKLDPENSNILFNLAEIEFVTHRWGTALKAFTKVIDKAPADNKSIHQLAQFKLMICHLKLNKLDEARKLSKLHADDKASLYSNYAEIVMTYHAGHEAKANKLRAEALQQFPNRAKHSVWLDTLSESGYILLPGAS